MQDELLDAASVLVKPGGLLVYSTCSVQHEENQQRVDSFLLRHTSFGAEAVQGQVAGACVSACGNLAVLPGVHSMDGAFAARLRRVS